MTNTPYWQDVLISLRRIIRATDLQSKRIVKACGLTIPQVMVLRAIESLGDVTVRRISDDVSLSQATVTTILNRLEDRQLIERIRSASDRRVVNARLTTDGREVLTRVPPLLHEEFITQFENLNDWEKTQILSSLQRIATMMDAESLDAAPILDIAAPAKDEQVAPQKATETTPA
ncbi:MarR family winged helix-turn-helix transcriptional regulator [Kistimonas asteriae]|uniref:MarR family winged helix-turn-helix transcriptional regulator n=1 Tax=Kistimonas asteriae TaxID=517724 RepID=UPI001BA96DCB|nr:MarR family winged helix-turn-helix transcriptional regulator [Kistimonas asteriae]